MRSVQPQCGHTAPFGHPNALAHRAPIVAKGELGKVTVEVLGADEVVDAEHLPVEQAPSNVAAVCADKVVLHVLADEVVDRIVS